MRAGERVDQLPGDADLIATFAHRAFEHVAHAQFTSDLLHIDSLPLVGEARISGDDEEPSNAGQRRDDFLDHTIDEIFLIEVA